MKKFNTLLLNITLMNFVINVVYSKDSSSFDYFHRDVIKNLEKIKNHVRPLDNSGMLKVENDEIFDFGTFDFIIVGAGAAGTVLANRLSEIFYWKVLLLEAGGEQTDFSDIPLYSTSLIQSDMDWGYSSTPQTHACQGMNNNSCPSYRGKVLGGTTTINAKLYARGNKEDYNQWAKLGNYGWSYDDVLPYFLKSERNHIKHLDENYHNFDGPLDISEIENSPYTDLYLKGWNELGLKTVDYNGKEQIGTSKIQFTQYLNKAKSGYRAFVEPVRFNRSNLFVTTNAFVTKVLIDRPVNWAFGVEFIKNNIKYKARAFKEVILSAGVFNTPQLLMLSGIGPKEELQKHNIRPYLNLPVGTNLQDHAITLLMFNTNLTAYNDTLEVDLKEYLHNHWPLISAFTMDTLAFINTKNANDPVANIQVHSQVPPTIDYSLNPFNFKPNIFKNVVNNFNRYSSTQHYVVLLNPKSRGKVTLKSNDIKDFPLINFNFLMAPEDIETLYQGVLKTTKLLDTKWFKKIDAKLFSVVDNCGELNMSREYWYCYIRQISQSLYHPVGTTSMGINKENSVVSPHLKVHGMKNLRVVDAGVIPVIPTANVQGPIYMIAEKISDHIKIEHLEN